MLTCNSLDMKVTISKLCVPFTLSTCLLGDDREYAFLPAFPQVSHAEIILRMLGTVGSIQVKMIILF